MTTKSYARLEEPGADEGARREIDMCVCAGAVGEPALSGECAPAKLGFAEQDRVAKTAEAIEQRLAAIVASMETGERPGAAPGVDRRTHDIEACLKTSAGLEKWTTTSLSSKADSTADGVGEQERAWFEARFCELKGAVERLASVNSSAGADDMTALNSRLEDLMGQLDRALGTQSHEEALKSLECQLAGLAGYLERSKEWAEARHLTFETRFVGIEDRLDNLGQAVERSHQAIQSVSEQTAAQISEAVRRLPPPPGLIRIERDVRALSVATREQDERTVEAVSELHGALRLILDQLASMGEKLSGVDEFLEDARERRMSPAAQEGVRDNVAPFGRVHVAPAQFGKRAGGAAAPGSGGAAQAGQRSSKLALVGAVAILLLTGAALFAHHLAGMRASELASGWPWQAKQVQPASRTSSLAAPRRHRAAAASGSAPSQAPEAASALPERRAAELPEAAERGGAERQGPEGDLNKAPPAGPVSSAVSLGPVFVEPASLPASLGSEHVRRAAIAGQAGAQYLVANYYESGQGVARDPYAAARWFRRAAEQNHAPSQYRLATLHERGQGVEKDLAAAERFYRSSAALGNVKAMHNLAVLLIHKQAEAPDYTGAAKWFKEAAERGFSDSQYNLAILYEQGLGVGRDAAMAYRWFSLSAQSEDRQAAAQRDRLRGRLPNDIAAGVDAELATWRPAAADEAANQAPEIGDEAQQDQARQEEKSAKAGPEKAAASVLVAPGSGRVARAAAPGAGARRSEPRKRQFSAAAVTDPRNAIAQTSLSQLGYELGPADGQVGPRTRQAIRQFQRDHGLTINGEVSDALLVKLAFARDNG